MYRVPPPLHTFQEHGANDCGADVQIYRVAMYLSILIISQYMELPNQKQCKVL